MLTTIVTGTARAGRYAITATGLTDKGVSRQENQDAIHLGPLKDAYLLAVADGVGGRNGGAWASRRALDVFTDALSRNDSADLVAAAQHANHRLIAEATGDESRNGAATTLVSMLISDRGVQWINAGDSRAYLIRAGEARQLTTDHSYVEGEVAAGRMSREEAESSPLRNVITRSLGGQQRVDIDHGGPLLPESDDTLLLCSDGLHGVVKPAEMAEAVSRTPTEAVEALVTLANQRGGPDNISVIIARIETAGERRGLLGRLFRR